MKLSFLIENFELKARVKRFSPQFGAGITFQTDYSLRPVSILFRFMAPYFIEMFTSQMMMIGWLLKRLWWILCLDTLRKPIDCWNQKRDSGGCIILIINRQTGQISLQKTDRLIVRVDWLLLDKLSHHSCTIGNKMTNGLRLNDGYNWTKCKMTICLEL